MPSSIVMMMPPGSRPGMSSLATAPTINPNTIAKAYHALDAEGVTVSRHGSGTFIAERRVTVTKAEQRRRVREGLDALLADAVHLGLTEGDVREEFGDAPRRVRFRPGAGEGNA